jgi:beta-lactamase superfamily II metal-dependent hydrolase
LLIGLALVVAGYVTRIWEHFPGGPVSHQDALAIRALDVGQGDSFLITTPGGKAVLIDAGPPEAAEKVVEALSRYGVAQLDLVIATHPHADHIGGMSKVLDSVAVKTFLDSGQSHPTQTFTRMLEKIRDKGIRFLIADAGQEFDLDSGIKLHVLGPTKPLIQNSKGSDENANSVIVRLTQGSFSMLFTGDSEDETERRLLDARAGVSAQILKVAHHGSRYATRREFLEAVNPELAVISCGAENDYGHPSQDTLNRLKPQVRELHRTDLEGEITIWSDGHNYEVQIERAAASATELWAGRTSRKTGAVSESENSNGRSRRRSASQAAGRWTMKLVVDRIEEGLAVCYVYDDDRTKFDIPIEYLPPGTRAGDHLTVTFEIDREGQEREQKRAEDLLRELTHGQPHEKKFKL